MVQEVVHPSSYNIKQIFSALTFNLHRKEVSQKRVRKVKKNGGNFEKMQEDEVLFGKTDEDPLTIATTSVSLTQATTHNISILNENRFQVD